MSVTTTPAGKTYCQRAQEIEEALRSEVPHPVGAAPRSAAQRSVTALLTATLLLALLVAPAIASADDNTATTVTGPATQPVHGQSATLTATVSNDTTPATVPKGSVQFYLDDTPIGAAVTLSVSGTAEIETAALSAGSHPVRATYLPSPGFIGSENTTTLTVGKANTTTILRITPSTTGVAGQDLAVEAEVQPTTPALGFPTGVVSFFVAGQMWAADTLDADGVSRGVAELPAISMTIAVTYEGDAHYAGSSGSAVVTVGKAGTVVALSASPNPALVNQRVTFTMTVDSLAPSMWWPSGELSAAVDSQQVPGTVTLDGSGSGGQFGRSFSSAGTYHVTAHFAGDEDFLASDAALDETVNAPGIANAAASTPAPASTPVPLTPTARAAARRLSMTVAPKRDRRRPYRFTISGSLTLPSNVTKAAGCTGKVNVVAKMKTKRVARKAATVSSACRFKTAVRVPRKGSVSITAAFAGNARITAITASAVKVQAG
jgi:Bacterial Ig-like domain (group 3)